MKKYTEKPSHLDLCFSQSTELFSSLIKHLQALLKFLELSRDKI